MKITGAVMTLNEEGMLAACLRSLAWCDEVLVVDSGSTDGTRSIAEQTGARVLTHAFTGFADQRNFMLEQAANPWVVMLDADERLPENAEILIRKVISSDTNVAYRFPRKSFYLRRWIRHGGWYPDYQTRLLRKDRNRFVRNTVHERVDSQGPVGTLSVEIHHQPFASMAEQVETNNRYSGLLARDMRDRKLWIALVNVFVKPVTKFVECYVVKRGFMDGFPGFFIAVSAAYSVFLKWSKVWELKRQA
jgi:glycosyltransferase involved in cell wall biosynthesis